MNIAIVGLSSNIGGVETFIINIYRKLKEDGHTFYFLTTEESICFENEIINNGDYILKYCARRTNVRKSKQDLQQIFKNYTFDLFWQNSCSLSSIQEIKMAYKFNVPCRIIHSHNSKNMKSALTLTLHSINKLFIHKYITQSFACSLVAAEWMFPSKVSKYTYIFHNSIDAAKFTYNKEKCEEIKKKFNLETSFVIGHVGRFHFQKNHIFLLEVFSCFIKKYPNSKLILCGDGELREKIVKIINHYDLQDNVILLGNKSEMADIYPMFDAILFPSLFEGLPFVLVEAQAAGIPCLISDSISKEVEITDLIEYESLNSDATVWADRLYATLLKNKKNTFGEIKKAGYDVNSNCYELYKILKEAD